MKLTNGQMAKSVALFEASSDGIKLRFNTLFRVKKNIIFMQDALKPFYETLKIVQNDYSSGKLNKEEADKAIVELSEVEIDVDIEKIPCEDFGDIEVSPSFVESIYYMIE